MTGLDDLPTNIKNKPFLQRRIPRRGPIFLRGFFPSTKNTKALYFESILELSVILTYECDPNVVFIDTQPNSINYQFNGKTTRYTTDILTQTADGKWIYTEVKPQQKLDKDKQKFKVLEHKYAKKNRKLLLVSEESLCPVRLKNLEIIYQGASSFNDIHVDTFDALHVLPPSTTISEAITLLKDNHFSSSILHLLLFKQQYVCDLSKPLTSETQLELNIF